MDKNRKLAELLGLCWHETTVDAYLKAGPPDAHLHHLPYGMIEVPPQCSCGLFACSHENPDYAADPRLVLREMILKCKDWDGFVDRIGARIGGQAYFHHAFILDTNGLCRDQAIVWLKRDERTD